MAYGSATEEHLPVGVAVYRFFQCRDIHKGNRDCRADTKDQQNKQSVENLVAELSDLPGVSQSLKHNQITSAFPPAASILALADSE